MHGIILWISGNAKGIQMLREKGRKENPKFRIGNFKGEVEPDMHHEGKWKYY